MSEREKLLRHIMEYDFAMGEMVLYLNTHPYEKKAISIHRMLADKSKELTERYENEYGPLTSKNTRSEDVWTWAIEPWPWDN